MPRRGVSAGERGRERRRRLSLLELREAFVQPRRRAPFRAEVHEAVRHLVPEHGEELRRDARDAARRHAHLSVEEAVRPRRRVRRGAEVALRVHDDHDLLDRARAEILDEVGVRPLERRQENALEARLHALPVVDEKDARARALGIALLDVPLLRGRGRGREEDRNEKGPLARASMRSS